MTAIAVIGGGPKAAALVAKANVLKSVFGHAPDIVVYEPEEIGAAWSGLHGYTDGVQPLCTLAERDLGFPYANSFGPAVAKELFAQYSWQRFCVEQGQGASGYEEWVLHDRMPPPHSHYALYLKWAFARSGALPREGQVTKLDYDIRSQKWLVQWLERSTGARHIDVHDAVVVTGSGPPHSPLPGAIDSSGKLHERVFDGHSFWKNLVKIADLLDKAPPDDRKLVLVGAGGTSAAIAHWFVRAKISIPITIIGREPTLYARHRGYFEDRLFSDEDAWSELPQHIREEFLNRLTRGVVWNYVLERLDGAPITYRCADADKFVALRSSPGMPVELQLKLLEVVPRGVSVKPSVLPQDGAVFVDARGFDRSWVSSLLGPTLALKPSAAKALETATANIDGALRLGAPLPLGLHAPSLATAQGPAANNLMALGWMSDRILRQYVTPPTPYLGPGTP